jgi:hypothetical protein
LYASIPESVYPVEKSSLVAFDLATNRQLWTASIDGDVIEGMVKEGNLLVVPRMFFSPANKNPQWWIDTWKTGTDSIQRLWTHQINASTVYGQNPHHLGQQLACLSVQRSAERICVQLPVDVSVTVKH